MEEILKPKPDEIELLKRIQARGREPLEPTVYSILVDMGIPQNRARYLLERKWPKKDLYDYGTSWAFGWLTEAGFDFVFDLPKEDEKEPPKKSS